MPRNSITQNDMKRMCHIWMHKVQISANFKGTQVLEMAIQIHIMATQNVLDFLFQVTYGNLTYMSLQWTLCSKVANTTQTLKSIQKLNWTCEFLSKEYKNLSIFKEKKNYITVVCVTDDLEKSLNPQVW
jgi:UDP-galactopyranose mutase